MGRAASCWPYGLRHRVPAAQSRVSTAASFLDVCG